MVHLQNAEFLLRFLFSVIRKNIESCSPSQCSTFSHSNEYSILKFFIFLSGHFVIGHPFVVKTNTSGKIYHCTVSRQQTPISGRNVSRLSKPSELYVFIDSIIIKEKYMKKWFKTWMNSIRFNKKVSYESEEKDSNDAAFLTLEEQLGISYD